jgi:hypothetical protein
MKYFFFFIIISTSFKSFSQITINDMIAVYKMDLDQFETFVLKRGYEFSSLKDDDQVFGSTYVKGFEGNTKYITLFTRYFSDGKCVTIQTSKEDEFLKFKEQLKIYGYKLVSTKNIEGRLYKSYKNTIWNLDVFSINDGDGITGYEISLTK